MFSIFTTYSNRPPNGSIQSTLIINKIDVFEPQHLCQTFPSCLYPFALCHIQESDILKRWYELKKLITSTLYIYINLCKLSPNLIIHLNNALKMSWSIVKMCLKAIWIGNLLYPFLKSVIIHFALIPLPPMSHIIIFWSNPLPY